MLRFIVIVFLAYLIASTGILGSFGTPKAEVSIRGSEVTVTTSASEMHFSAGPPERISGRVLDWRKSPGSFGKMGVQAIAAMLDASGYAEFQSIQKAGRCPASFLNRNAQTYIFYTENQGVARKVRSAGYEEGDEVSLRVRRLSFEEGTYKGYEMKAFSNREKVYLVLQ